MSQVLADRVQETTTTTGTGTLTLGGAVAQFQSFASGIGASNTTLYCLLDGNGTAWETGLGTVGSGTLARTTVFTSTNSNSAINLSSNTHHVFCDLPSNQLRSQTPFPLVANLPLTTWQNQGGASLTDTSVGIVFNAPSSSGDNNRFYLMAAPSTPYSFVAQIAITQEDIPSSGNNGAMGLGWTDGTASQFIALKQGGSGGGNGLFQVCVQHYSGATSYAGADFNGSQPHDSFWLKVRDDGTNVYFMASADGLNFYTPYSVAKSGGYLGSSGYSNVGLFGNAAGNNTYGTITAFSQGT